MSRTPDYVGEMALSVTEQEAEALLSRSGVVGDDLLEVAVILETVRSRAMPEPEQDFSHLFEAAVRESRLTPIERFANQQISITDDWKPRVAKQLATGALVLFALVVSSTGLAYAANGASPGDLLYGVDRALEIVGIGDGGAGERLAEAQALVAGGVAADEGTTTTQTVVPQGNESVIAIAEAAERIANQPVGPEDNEAVQNLLDYIHGQHENGLPVDGGEVSRRAHEIGADPGSARDDPGTADEDPPGHQNDTTEPGNSENAPGQQKKEEPATTENTGDDPNDAPGNSENAPGQQKKDRGSDDSGDDPNDAPGNSENAPGQQKKNESATEDASGDDPNDAPGNSENAPGQGGQNPGRGPSGGGPPGQGGGD